MAHKDKEKWNKKYSETPTLLQERPVSKKLHLALQHVEGKKAVDIACGAGRNALFLAKNDFDVEAMDISEVALQTLDEHKITNITTTLVDLEGFVPSKTYDLIVKTNYLDKTLIQELQKSLQQGSVVFIETYMDHPSNNKPNSNPDYLLKAGELKSFFDDSFEVIDYDEFDNESYEIYRMKKQSIIVKKLT